MRILGVDIGGTNIRAGLVEQNEVGKVESILIKKNGTEKEVLDQLMSMIDPFAGEDLQGIGVGVPTVVDVDRGIIYNVQNIPSWKEVHLKELLEAHYHIPTSINNDANCFVIGEKYFGKARQYKNVVGLIIGTGLGAGILVNDCLYAGMNCGAGEFGSIPFKDQTYEYYCSGQFFIQTYGAAGKEIARKAVTGDSQAREVMNRFGSNLGEAIKMIMYAYDPEAIILGGSVSKSFSLFRDAMWKSIKTFAYPKSIENIAIEVSEKEHIAILGAAALHYDTKRTELDEGT